MSNIYGIWYGNKNVLLYGKYIYIFFFINIPEKYPRYTQKYFYQSFFLYYYLNSLWAANMLCFVCKPWTLPCYCYYVTRKYVKTNFDHLKDIERFDKLFVITYVTHKLH